MTLRRNLYLVALLACGLPLLATRPVKTKVKAPAPSPDHLLTEAETAYRTYRFETAQGALTKYQTALQRRREALPERAKVLQDQLARAVRMYATAEALHVVDSTLVAKRDWVSRLPQGGGRLQAEAHQLAGDSLMQALAYQDALGKNLLRSAGRGLQWLSAVGASGAETWEATPIDFSGLSPDSTLASPFLLEDGVTLIFARTTGQGLGGYDLYMSRQEGNGFFRPTLLGMPYNSPANDYLLAYHESEGWGILVSDRFAPADSLHIYRFTGRPAFLSSRGEPSETAEPAELTDEERFRRATLQGVLYTDRPVTPAKSPAPAVAKSELYFILQDDRVYHRWEDFTTSEGLNAFRRAEDLRQTLEARLKELSSLRERWDSAPSSDRASLSSEIRLLEATTLKLRTDLKQALRQARYYEGVR